MRRTRRIPVVGVAGGASDGYLVKVGYRDERVGLREKRARLSAELEELQDLLRERRHRRAVVEAEARTLRQEKRSESSAAGAEGSTVADALLGATVALAVATVPAIATGTLIALGPAALVGAMAGVVVGGRRG